MREADLALLIRAARGAGAVAKRFAGRTARRWDKPGEAGPVTEADLAVNDYLAETLRNARPDYGWLSEESEDDPARLEAEAVFIIDPIDGTRSFIEGGHTWSHSMAVVRGGQVVAGVVYLPMRERLFAAAAGEGATMNDAPIRSSSCAEFAMAEILATRHSLDARFWRGPVPGFERAYRPSLAYRMALVGQGRFDGMLTFRRTWEWDIAAGALIAAEAGAAVSDREGKPLVFNRPDPRARGIIAAPSPLHAQLVAKHLPEG